MSRIFEARNNMSVIIVFFFMGLFLAANLSTVESRNDLTTLDWYDCNEETVSTNDPYVTVVNNLLNNIATTAPNQANYEFSTSNTEQGVTAYGYGNCKANIVSNSDQCGECLTTCNGMFLTLCGPAFGAQIQLTACYVRYENYTFR